MTKPHIIKVEDHEGNGICAQCGREGLRWIATLSDETTCGLECAKKACGYKPAPKTYNWVADFRPIAQHDDGGDIFIMWQHKQGAATRETRNANLVTVGGVQQKWQQRGWAA